MTQASFHLAFDIANQSPPTWRDFTLGFVFIGIGALLVVLDAFGIKYSPSKFWEKNPTLSKLFNYTFLLLSLIITIISYHNTYSEYCRLRDANMNGQAQIIEGKVENFIPLPYNGHAEESFTINGRKFAYSDYVGGFAFNKTSSHGGPIKPGQLVRITFVENAIIRLEIAQ